MPYRLDFTPSQRAKVGAMLLAASQRTLAPDWTARAARSFLDREIASHDGGSYWLTPRDEMPGAVRDCRFAPDDEKRIIRAIRAGDRLHYGVADQQAKPLKTDAPRGWDVVEA